MECLNCLLKIDITNPQHLIHEVELAFNLTIRSPTQQLLKVAFSLYFICELLVTSLCLYL